MSDAITPIQVHSAYSILAGSTGLAAGGTAMPRELVEIARSLGHSHLAITDTNCLAGAPAFHKLATDAGLRPLIGAELVEEGNAPLVTLIAEEAGYANLCQLITRRCANDEIPLSPKPTDGDPSVSMSREKDASQNTSPRGGMGGPPRGNAYALLSDVGELQEGLLFLTEDPAAARRFVGILDRRRLWLGIDPATQSSRQLRELLRCAEECSLPLAASGKALLARQGDLELARLLTAIRLGKTFDTVREDELPHSGAFLRSGEVLASQLADFPQAAANNRRIVERCEGFHLLPRKAVFPRFVRSELRGEGVPPLRVADILSARGEGILPSAVSSSSSSAAAARAAGMKKTTKEGEEAKEEEEEARGRDARGTRGQDVRDTQKQDARATDAHATLRRLCRVGLRTRYGRSPPEGAHARLEKELDLIQKMGFCEYFLVIWDIVRYARSRRTPVAGRGSGASSLVAYLLGITNVCPLRYRIPFERFLHAGREDYPDLDVDFCWRLRDEVIDYVFRRWGTDRAAMVCMHNTFQERSALRETAKAFGFSDEQISGGEALEEEEKEEEKEKTEETHGRDAHDTHGQDGHATRGRDARDTQATRMRRIVALARRLVGLPHNFSVHPGGVVMGAMDIDHYAPVQPSPKGVRITQYDKDGVEAMGLVKLDILGNRNLSTVREACERIARRHGRRLNVETVPPEDPATVRLLQEADTVGCNQLESPAMRHLLRMMRPAGAADVMQALALIRPGAAGIGMKETYVRRRRGLEKTPVAPLPVADLLDETRGVMMYEDDVMIVAAALGGLTLGEADRFRKAVQKCATDEQRLRLSRDFLSRCRARGVDLDYAKDLWVQMAKFNAYSFCRAHAASYAAIAYAGAYLKTHYPLEFWTAALNNNQGMYHPRVYVELAKRDGIRFLLPDVNRSEAEFSLCSMGVPPVRVADILSARAEGILPSIASSFVSSSSSSSAAAPAAAPPAIRIGLGLVEGLGPTGVEQILRHRSAGPFEGLSDFLLRTGLGYTETRNLILCGAFDWTGRHRPALMMELNLFVRLGPRPTSYRPAAALQHTLVSSSRNPTHHDGSPKPTHRNGSVLGTASAGAGLLLPVVPVIPNVPGDYEYERKYRDELSILGVSAREHYLAFCRQRNPRLAELAGTDSRRLRSLVGRPVRLAGVVEARRYTSTRAGQTMLFLTMADEQGTFEASLFPDALSRAGGGVERYGPYVVTGTVEDQYGAITVSAEDVQVDSLTG